MDLGIVAYRLEDGLWAFDYEPNDTIEELLCNGTEEVIDSYYYFSTGKDAVAGDRMRIHLSDEEPDDWDTVLTFQYGDADGSTYMDEVMCAKVWLCPWLQGYFGYIPGHIWVSIDPVNDGLEHFVKVTGMKKFLDRK